MIDPLTGSCGRCGKTYDQHPGGFCPDGVVHGLVRVETAPQYEPRWPDEELVVLAFTLRHINHEGIPGAPAGVFCPRCVAESALARLVTVRDAALAFVEAQEDQQGWGENYEYPADEYNAMKEALRDV